MEERNNFYLTKEGLKDLKKEYQSLKAIKAAKLRGEAPNILESEDLNPDFVVFQEDLNFIESRIAELEIIIEKALLIKNPAEKNIVDLGATVDLLINGQKDEFTIVGTLEANPMLGKISNESPVGKALLGHKIGEEVIVSSPVKTIYKIRKIKYN